MRLNVQTLDGSVKILANTHEIKHLTVARNLVKAISGVFSEEAERESARACFQELDRILELLMPEPAVVS